MSKEERVLVCVVAILTAGRGMADNGSSDNRLRSCVENAWNISWSAFYKPETHLFYDYLTSYEHGKGLAHLPAVDEVKRQFPNTCGYGTGMEDCMISAGVMLDMIVDRYAVTGEENMKDCAREVVKGIRLCTLSHGYTGFVARAVCHEDLKSIYISSSRDQYTHAVYGLWVYARSPLADVGDKEGVGEILVAISDRMMRTVVPENNYDSLRADGTRDDRGISRMWKVMSHEAARLPMIYAATWDVSGRQKYYDEYRKYIVPAVEQSLAFEKNPQPSSWVLPQMQCSFELLTALETDQELKKKIAAVTAMVTRCGEQRAKSAMQRSKTLDLHALAPDWRESGGLVNPYRLSWYCIREAGEALLSQLMDPQCVFKDEQRDMLRDWFFKLDDFSRVSSCGIFHLQEAYWKARRRGFFHGHLEVKP